jgi:hypothetical protein
MRRLRAHAGPSNASDGNQLADATALAALHSCKSAFALPRLGVRFVREAVVSVRAQSYFFPCFFG